MEMKIRKPIDGHVHVRQGEMLQTVLPYTVRHCSAAVIMPNTKPPILTAADADRYQVEILKTAHGIDPLFRPIMTLYFTEETTPDVVRLAHSVGVKAVKFYPKGATTNSGHGLRFSDLPDHLRTLAEMEALGMVLCGHWEDPDEPERRNREFMAVPMLETIAKGFPNLKIVFEHVSSRRGVETVLAHKNIVATVTAHHLALTEKDWIDNTHHLCMPVIKDPEDREALWSVIHHEKFFFGSDSAPHSPETKTGDHPAYGVYSAPIAIPLLATLFEQRKVLNHLEDFTSRRCARFYGLGDMGDEPKMSLVRLPSVVPIDFGGIVPLWAGKRLNWFVS